VQGGDLVATGMAVTGLFSTVPLYSFLQIHIKATRTPNRLSRWSDRSRAITRS